MALSPETLQQIHSSFTDAMETIGDSVWDTPENRRIVSQFMLQEGLPQAMWVSSFIVQASILECRKRGLLNERPPAKTREQIERERAAADRYDGTLGNATSKYVPKKKATQEEIDAARASLADAMDPIGVRRRKEAEKATQEAHAQQEQQACMDSIPVEIPFEQYNKMQRAAFKKLTPENIKRVNARHREYVRLHPPVEAE